MNLLNGIMGEKREPEITAMYLIFRISWFIF